MFGQYHQNITWYRPGHQCLRSEETHHWYWPRHGHHTIFWRGQWWWCFMIKCNLSKYFLSQVLTDLYSPWNSQLCWYQLWLLLLSHNSNPLSELINIYSTQADTIYDAWSDLWKEKATFIKCLFIVSLDYVNRILWTISGGQWKREILYLQSIVVSQTIFSLSCVSVSR